MLLLSGYIVANDTTRQEQDIIDYITMLGRQAVYEWGNGNRNEFKKLAEEIIRTDQDINSDMFIGNDKSTAGRITAMRVTARVREKTDRIVNMINGIVDDIRQEGTYNNPGRKLTVLILGIISLFVLRVFRANR